MRREAKNILRGRIGANVVSLLFQAHEVHAVGHQVVHPVSADTGAGNQVQLYGQCSG